MDKKVYVFIGVVLFVSLLAASYRYSLVGKTCLTGGCYGPMKLVLKTTTGEPVEDVVIEASLRGPGGLFCLHGTCHVDIYREIMVVNTDEEFFLPRSFFVRRTIDETGNSIAFAMSFNVYHPDYQNIDYHVKVPNKQKGLVDLGVKNIISIQVMRDKGNKSSAQSWRERGWSEEKINKRLEGRLVRPPGDRLKVTYFAKAVAAGREDIVDKYLPDMLYANLAEQKYDMSYYEEYNRRIRNAIWKKSKEF